MAGAPLDRVGQAIREAGSRVEFTVESSALHHMLHGSELIKARQQPVRRLFRLSPDLARIHWPSKHRRAEHAVYRIGDIKEIMCAARGQACRLTGCRRGRQTASFARTVAAAKNASYRQLLSNEELCFSLVIGEVACAWMRGPG